jgi:hypothetical protein
MEKNKLLVTIDERRAIHKDMSYEFGTKIKHRVMDLEKVVDRIRAERSRYSLSPYIEIKPISPDMHKMPSRTSTFQKDPITGVLYGIPIDQDEFGNMKWQKIQIGDNLSLSLDNNNEAKIWAVLRFCPDIKGSPFQMQNPYYEIYDPVEVARNEMSEVEAMKKSFDRIDMVKQKPIEMVMFARYLGEEIRENASFDIVYNTLLRFARSYPVEFNRKWESKSRSYGERFATARAIGVVTQDIDRGFVFRNIPLGLTEEEAIRFLAKDMNIMNAINDQIQEEDLVVIGMKKELLYIDEKKKAKDKVEKEEAELVETETVEIKSGKGTKKVQVDDF